MFEIFGALFGGAYLATKLKSDKTKRVKYQAEYNQKKEIKDAFFNKYATDVYEWEKLTHWFKIANPDDKQMYYDEIRSLEEELTPIVGIKPTSSMIYWGMLAKKGKIPPEMEVSNINNSLLSPLSVHDFDYCFYDYTPEERNWFRLNFLQWYDKTICDNGMEYKLLYVKRIHDTRVNEIPKVISNIEVLSHDDPFGITAYWEPMCWLVMR